MSVEKHAVAARKYLKDTAKVDWQDETLWLVRGKRDRLAKALPEWEALRDAASRIKLYSNSRTRYHNKSNSIWCARCYNSNWNNGMAST